MLENKKIFSKILRYPRPDVAELYSLSDPTGKDLGFRIFKEEIELSSPKYYFIWSYNLEKKEYFYLFPLHPCLAHYQQTTQSPETIFQETTPLLDPNKDCTLSYLENRSFSSQYFPKKAQDVLIVGSAPSIERYREQIKKATGECWALNDALFYLEKHKISVEKAFITDARFIKKAISTIIQSKCSIFITIDTVPLDLIKATKKHFLIFKSLGRDGFSTDYGKIFHGCSVFFCALQTAVALKYQSITTCGVLFPPPSRYVRIDESKNLPEFVHTIQLNNAHRALTVLRKINLDLKIMEPESNLNFL